MSLLVATELTLKIGGRLILDRVSLSVAPREVLGLVGASGSGKSMAARALMRLAPEGAEVSGRIALDGREISALSEKEMCAVRGRDLAMIFQEPMSALNPVQPIGAQIAECFRVHGRMGAAAAQARAAELIARVGLMASGVGPDRYPHELSGGQRQRAVIAIAIAHGPKLLIADEPTTALDVAAQADIVALLRDLAAEGGMGLVFISHDLALVAGIAHRIAAMEAGRVVETGAVRDIIGRPGHPATQRLVAAARPPRRAARPAPAPAEILGLERACRVYRRKGTAHRAVDGVTMAIRAGETVGLVGESGSGKSTLARMLLALEAFDGGALRLDGRPLRIRTERDLRALRRSAQIVFQDPQDSLNPRHKAERIVAEPMRLLAPPPGAAAQRAAARAMLARVGVDPARAGGYPHEFSGGERQRIAIARALVIRPKLVVLDEAASALDAATRNEILDLLGSLSAEFGIAYLFITHDISLVRAFADRILVMKDGRIVDEGPPDLLFGEAAAPYTRMLAAAAPTLDAPRAFASGPDVT